MIPSKASATAKAVRRADRSRFPKKIAELRSISGIWDRAKQHIRLLVLRDALWESNAYPARSAHIELAQPALGVSSGVSFISKLVLDRANESEDGLCGVVESM